MAVDPSSGVAIEGGGRRSEGRVSYDEPEDDDFAIAYIKDSNPFAFIASVVRQGSIRRCPGHLDLSSCGSLRSLSPYASFRIACSLLHIEALNYFSRHSQGRRSSSFNFALPASATIRADSEGHVDVDGEGLRDESAAHRMATLCAFASKLAYEEQEPSVEAVVNEQWNMKFIRFFDCWNEYLGARTTQALMFADADADASVVVVAFRGTEALNWQDWATDLDFSYYKIRGLGRVHMGFLEALGLGTRRDPSTLRAAGANLARKASSEDHHHDHRHRPNAAEYRPTSGIDIDPSDKTLAYDAISGKLDEVLDANPRAKLYVTGHSLGGALATLFVALRLFENQGTDPRLGGVFTFGQPRVGDEAFVEYMETRLGQLPQAEPRRRKYFRVVFRRDLVSRVPSDGVLFRFKHIRPCHFYESMSKSQVLHEQPFRNFLLNILVPTARLTALIELIQSLVAKLLKRPTILDESVPLGLRFLAVLMPATCSHMMVYYIDAIKNAPSSFLGQPI